MVVWEENKRDGWRERKNKKRLVGHIIKTEVEKKKEYERGRIR